MHICQWTPSHKTATNITANMLTNYVLKYSLQYASALPAGSHFKYHGYYMMSHDWTMLHILRYVACDR